MATPPTLSSFWLLLFLAIIISSSIKLTFALDNGLGLTPPMGFNTWNAFHCDISESLFLKMADTLLDLKLDTYGYKYVNLDDCWMSKNRTNADDTGEYQSDPVRFPHGMKYIGDYLHQRGLLFGIYSSAGTMTCQRLPGSLDHEIIDATTFAEYGVDYLKLDNCYNENIPGIDRYTKMRNALNATGRPIFFSLCQWGVEESWKWAPSIGNSWRTTDDISKNWNSIVNNFWSSHETSASFSRAGAWADPDMLEIGNGMLNDEESKSHFALWVFAKAPLLIGTDLTQISSTDVAILTNQHLIDIHQDPGSVQAQCYRGCNKDHDWSIFATTCSNGDTVVLIVNWSDDAEIIPTLTGQNVGVAPWPHQQVVVTDLWNNGEIVGTYDFEGLKDIPVPPLASHACAVYRFHTIENDDRLAMAD